MLKRTPNKKNVVAILILIEEICLGQFQLLMIVATPPSVLSPGETQDNRVHSVLLRYEKGCN